MVSFDLSFDELIQRALLKGSDTEWSSALSNYIRLMPDDVWSAFCQEACRLWKTGQSPSLAIRNAADTLGPVNYVGIFRGDSARHSTVFRHLIRLVDDETWGDLDQTIESWAGARRNFLAGDAEPAAPEVHVDRDENVVPLRASSEDRSNHTGSQRTGSRSEIAPTRESVSEKPIRKVCDVCASEDIILDSRSTWDKDKQDWIHVDPEDIQHSEVWCEQCEAITAFREEEID